MKYIEKIINDYDLKDMLLIKEYEFKVDKDVNLIIQVIYCIKDNTHYKVINNMTIVEGKYFNKTKIIDRQQGSIKK